jgi:FtsH-binding integral membrane protein
MPFSRNTPIPYSPDHIATEQANFMRKVYGYMSAGLGATALTSWGLSQSTDAMNYLMMNSWLFFALLIAEFILVSVLAAAVRNVRAPTAAAMFFGYSVLNGVTLSLLFLLYTKASLMATFVVSAGTFGAMSAYGYTTKRDLTSMGSFLIMGLFGLVIASLVNLFLHSPMISWMTSFFGVFIFVGLTAYDTQKIKALNIIGNEGTEEDQKEAIHGALILYLDFINLFLYLLRFMGRRK